MATASAAASIENSFRHGMVKRLSVISMSFLERILKTCGPYDHDQWPPEPTVGPINPGMLTKISKQASEEYLNIMLESQRDALSEFDGRLLRQVLRNVVYQTLSVSRKAPRATSPQRTLDGGSTSASAASAAGGGGGTEYDFGGGSQFTSPGATPRGGTAGGADHMPHGMSPLPLGNITSASAILASPSTGRGSTPGSSARRGNKRFLVLHPAKAEAMMHAKKMLDPLIQTAKFPREAYKAVVMDTGDMFMDRFHPTEANMHLSAENKHKIDMLPDSYTLQVPEREWITATVLSSISRIVVNEDGSVSVNGRVVAFAPGSSAGGGYGRSPSRGSTVSRGTAGSPPDNSFLRQLQKLREILSNDDRDNVPNFDPAQVAAQMVAAGGGESPGNTPRGGGNNQQQQQPKQEKLTFKERVVAILSSHAPQKLDRVDKYVAQGEGGREEDVIAALVSKFGPEPISFLSNEAQDTNVPLVRDPNTVSASLSGNNNNNTSTAGTGAGGGGEVNMEEISKKDKLERDIANIQYQMQTMQSQLAAAQTELKQLSAATSTPTAAATTTTTGGEQQEEGKAAAAAAEGNTAPPPSATTAASAAAGGGEAQPEGVSL